MHAFYWPGQQSTTPVESSECSPEVFVRELSWAVFRFSGVLFWFLAQPCSFLGMVKNKKVRTGARNNMMRDIWSFLVKNHVPKMAIHGQTVKLRLWRSEQLLMKALGKLKGTSWEVYGCFWPSRRVNHGFPRVFDKKKNTSQEPFRKITCSQSTSWYAPGMLCLRLSRNYFWFLVSSLRTRYGLLVLFSTLVLFSGLACTMMCICVSVPGALAS